jgi:hypothetical protein
MSDKVINMNDNRLNIIKDVYEKTTNVFVDNLLMVSNINFSQKRFIAHHVFLGLLTSFYEIISSESDKDSAKAFIEGIFNDLKDGLGLKDDSPA